MIHNFDDFCLWAYVIVDDIWLQIAWLFKRPRPKPLCSDSELIAMALVGECQGWDQETEMLSRMKEHQDLFKHIPSQSRFNRRRRHLMHGFNLVRRIILQALDVAQDRQGVIDSLPIPMVQFHLAPGSTGEWGLMVLHLVKCRPSKRPFMVTSFIYYWPSLAGSFLIFNWLQPTSPIGKLALKS